MARVNSITRGTQLAVYHTSVRVGSLFEIYYGFSDYGKTGVDYAPKINRLPSCMKGKLYDTILMGSTKKTEEEIKSIQRRFEKNPAWLSDRYNVFYHNCHQFSYWFCYSLLGDNAMKNFPSYVFQCEHLGAKLYQGFFKIFINNSDPPTFLGKCPESNEKKCFSIK